MYRVQISRLARKDLLDALEYIRVDLEKNIVNGGGYRYLICETYLIFYRVERYSVYVDRILHGSQDYLCILSPREG